MYAAYLAAKSTSIESLVSPEVTTQSLLHGTEILTEASWLSLYCVSVPELWWEFTITTPRFTFSSIGDPLNETQVAHYQMLGNFIITNKVVLALDLPKP